MYGRIPYEELYSMNSDGSDRRVLQVMKAIRGPSAELQTSAGETSVALACTMPCLAVGSKPHREQVRVLQLKS